MFGEKLDRKVSQIDASRIIEDPAVLKDDVRRKTRGAPALDGTVFAAARIAERVEHSGRVNGHRWGSGRTARSRGRDFEMLAEASFCCKVYYTMLPSKRMTSPPVSRCLFGKPNSRETIEMLQKALDVERNRFKDRWGVDPKSSEDKENNYRRRNNDKAEQSPNRKRSNPYSRQTSIHDYWRARKMCEVNKKPLTVSTDVSKQQNIEPSKTMKTTTTTATKTT